MFCMYTLDPKPNRVTITRGSHVDVFTHVNG